MSECMTQSIIMFHLMMIKSDNGNSVPNEAKQSNVSIFQLQQSE